MKLGNLVLKNYGSYEHVEFDYSNLGLTLVSGPTKSGKSTLLDGPGWVLFGQTSKDLNADDVKSWFAESETSGVLSVFTACSKVIITRIRGPRPAQNDFYFQTDGGAPVRGKDAVDTQKLLNALLGVNAELYFAASYLHQFTSDKFFTAKAKERRESMEKIANMDLAITLGERASSARKATKLELEDARQTMASCQGQIAALKSSVTGQVAAQARWAEKNTSEIDSLLRLFDSFDTDREARVYKLVDELEVLDKMIRPREEFPARIKQAQEQVRMMEPLDKELRALNARSSELQAEIRAGDREIKKYENLTGTCPTCLGPADNHNRAEHLAYTQARIRTLAEENRVVQNEVARLTAALESRPKIMDALSRITIEQSENNALIAKFESVRAKALSLREEKNPHESAIERARAQVNPYDSEIEKTQTRLALAQHELQEASTAITQLEHDITSLTWLYDKSYELRGLCLAQSVKTINDRTNAILERYFDATLRVDFSLADSDKLEVTITNEGYECKYAQLSGGERCMLKLAFSIGYMQAAENTAGVKFDTLMLDEALHGLDASLKVNAFGLLQELAEQYTTVLCIEHSEEFKQLFSNRFLVSKDGAHSSIESAV